MVVRRQFILENAVLVRLRFLWDMEKKQRIRVAFYLFLKTQLAGQPWV